MTALCAYYGMPCEARYSSSAIVTGFEASVSEKFPTVLSPANSYLVGEQKPWSAALVCPCGCKDVIQLSLLPNDSPKWTATSDRKGMPTLSPSVWRTTGCRSHFFLRQGSIVRCRPEPHDLGTRHSS
jgi:hypothetical protein